MDIQNQSDFVAALSSSIAITVANLLAQTPGKVAAQPSKAATQSSKGFEGRLGKYEEGKGFFVIDRSNGKEVMLPVELRGHEVVLNPKQSKTVEDQAATKEKAQLAAINEPCANGVELRTEQAPASNAGEVETAVVVYEKAAANTSKSEWNDCSSVSKQVSAWLQPIKQELDTPPAKVTTKDGAYAQKTTMFASQVLSGLAASRFAAVPSSKPTGPFTKSTAAIKQEQKTQPETDHKVQGHLADPADFMSAAINRSPTVKSATSASRAPATSVKLVPQPAKLVATESQPQKAQSTTAQPVPVKIETSQGPQLPLTNGERVEADTRGPSQPVGITNASLSSVEKYESMSFDQAASAWNTFAQAEKKENKWAVKQVKFVPASKPLEAESKAPVVPEPANGVMKSDSQPPASTNGTSMSENEKTNKVLNENMWIAYEKQGEELETIRQELAAYKTEHRLLEKKLETEAQELKKAQAELAVLKNKLVTPSAPVRGPVPTAAKMEWLETRNKELERDIARMRPMFEIGRDVRIRYLEEVRVYLFKFPNTDTDKDVIHRGHAAAFHANCKVDTAVMTGGVLSNLQRRMFQPVFKVLYNEDADQMHKVSNKMKTAMEGFATILTSRACNSNHLGVPRDEMLRVQDIVQLMARKHAELGAKVFEEDQSGHAAYFLRQLEEAMVPIAKFDLKWYRAAVKHQLEKEGESPAEASSAIPTPLKLR